MGQLDSVIAFPEEAAADQNGGATCCECGQHAQGSAGNAKHVGQGEADEDGDGDNNAGDDGRLVAKGQAENDVGGSTCSARISHILQERVGTVSMSASLERRIPTWRLKIQIAHLLVWQYIPQQMADLQRKVNGGYIIGKCHAVVARLWVSCLRCVYSSQSNLHGPVAVAGVVLSGQPNDEASPKASGNAEE